MAAALLLALTMLIASSNCEDTSGTEAVDPNDSPSTTNSSSLGSDSAEYPKSLKSTSSGALGSSESRSSGALESLTSAASESLTFAASESLTSAASESLTSAASEPLTSSDSESVTSAASESLKSAASESLTSAASEPLTSSDSESVTSAASEPLTSADLESLTSAASEAPTTVTGTDFLDQPESSKHDSNSDVSETQESLISSSDYSVSAVDEMSSTIETQEGFSSVARDLVTVAAMEFDASCEWECDEDGNNCGSECRIGGKVVD